MAPPSIPLDAKQRSTVARLRLAAQGLVPGVPAATATAAARTPHDVVAALGMIQAQDLSQACWAVGSRLPGSTLADVHAALDAGSVIRSWGARGTLMLVVPQAYRTLLAVTAPRMNAKMAATRARENITEAEITRLAEVARERCAGAGATRAALLDAFAEAGSSIAGQRGYHLIVAVSLRGAIVQGPMEPGSGTRQLFMPTGSWIPAGPEVPDGHRALGQLVRTYFESHGPATVADCAWWLGLPLTPVRAAVADLEGVLGSREPGGVAHHFAAEHLGRWEDPPGTRTVVALPGFDEFLLGYQDRSATLDPAYADVVTPGKNGLFRRTVAVGGQMIGTWEIVGPGNSRSARFMPFSRPPVPAQARAIAARLDAYLGFRQ